MKTLQYKNKEGQWISLPIIGGVGDVTAEDIVNFIDSAKYNEETQEIEFYHGETLVSALDATPFIVDNFVKEVEIIGTDLVITFNTEDKPAIRVSLADIFNPDNYYTKEEVEKRLDEELYIEGPDTNGYEYVDLGLPSGLLWATCNVGASKPEETGLYFAWGETEGYKSASDKSGGFAWSTYKFGGSTAYNSQSKYNESDGLATLETEDDAVKVNISALRMPTYDDFKELVNNTIPGDGANSYGWIDDYNGTGVSGLLRKSKINSNDIFFPATGFINDTSTVNEGGHYWSSSIYPESNSAAYNLFFNSWLLAPNMDDSRYRGLTIRGILDPTIKTKFPKYLTKSEASETYAKKEDIKGLTKEEADETYQPKFEVGEGLEMTEEGVLNVTSTGGSASITKEAVEEVLTGDITSHTHSQYLTETDLNGYAKSTDIPTNNNQLTNGAGYITSSGSCSSATTATSLSTSGAQYRQMLGYTTATTLASTPITYKTRYVTATAASTLSISTITNGVEVQIIIYNNASSALTFTIPNTGNYVSFNGTTLTIPSKAYGEINVVCAGGKAFIRFSA